MNSPTRSAWTHRSMLCALLVVGLALRLWGITFGLPLWSNYYVRPDESLIVEPALRLGTDPQLFFYPALMSTLTGAAYAGYHVVLSLFGDGAERVSLVTRAGADLDPLFLLARVLSAVAGTLAAIPVYTAAAALGGRWAGLLAAALLLTSPLAVRDAHYGVTDTLSMAMIALTLGLTIRLPSTRRRVQAVCGIGACAGLAVASKYTGAFVWPAVIVGVAWTAPAATRRRDLAYAAATGAAVFAVINPYLFAHWREFVATVGVLADASYQRAHADGPWSIVNSLRHLALPLQDGPALWLGPPLAVAGIVLACTRATTRAAGLVGLAAAVGIGAPLFLAHVLPYRYTLPLLPAIAVFAPLPLLALTGRVGRVLMLGTAVVVLAAGLGRSAQLVRRLAAPDTRSLAGEWIATHVPAACPVVMWASPETEPQVRETAASTARRIRYVHVLYGDVSGDVVSRLYRVVETALMEGRARDASSRYEVYRSTDAPTEASCVALVLAGYPGWAASSATADELTAATRGRLVGRASFSPFRDGVFSAPVEPLDAFFLPMQHLDRVVRPGPVIEVLLYQRP